MHILQTREGIEALRDLGVTTADLDRVRQTPFPQSKKMLADLKYRVKHAFRKLAVALHPDQTGGDPVKTERFRLIVQVKEAFDRMEVVPLPPRPMPPVMPPIAWSAAFVRRRVSTTGPTVSSNTTYYVSPFDGTGTGSTTGPTVTAWRVSKMRPF